MCVLACGVSSPLWAVPVKERTLDKSPQIINLELLIELTAHLIFSKVTYNVKHINLTFNTDWETYY